MAEHRSERQRRGDTATRRCIVSGEATPRAALIRFVVGPDDIVVPDLSERLPGRGLWLAGRRDIVAQACATKAFRRAARRPVTPLSGPQGEALADLVDAQLARRCLDALGLARRAGLVTMGFEQVRAALKDRAAAGGRSAGSLILLSARDAADDGRGKIKALADRLAEGGVAVTNLALFDAKTLGSAVGRDQVVHVLVETDGAGRRLDAALHRLAAYRGVVPLIDGMRGRVAPADVVDME